MKRIEGQTKVFLIRRIYLKASVKDSVDNDKGEEGDKPGPANYSFFKFLMIGY